MAKFRWLILACCCGMLGGAAAAQSAPTGRITFGNPEWQEVYDFSRLRLSLGGHAGFMFELCSNDTFHCVASVNPIIAPRSCDLADRSLRRHARWKVGSESAVLLFATPGGDYYFGSDSTSLDKHLRRPGRSGFVYRRDKGIVGLWYSNDIVPVDPSPDLRKSVVARTKTIADGQQLFACTPNG